MLGGQLADTDSSTGCTLALSPIVLPISAAELHRSRVWRHHRRLLRGDDVGERKRAPAFATVGSATCHMCVASAAMLCNSSASACWCSERGTSARRLVSISRTARVALMIGSRALAGVLHAFAGTFSSDGDASGAARQAFSALTCGGTKNRRWAGGGSSVGQDQVHEASASGTGESPRGASAWWHGRRCWSARFSLCQEENQAALSSSRPYGWRTMQRTRQPSARRRFGRGSPSAAEAARSDARTLVVAEAAEKEARSGSSLWARGVRRALHRD